MVCTFYLTSERVTASEKETGVFTVQTRGKLAETVRKHIHEGRGVRVVGRLKEVQWTGADGKRQSTVFIAAEHVEFHPEQLKKPPKKNRRSSTAQDK
jgi:single-strand DNA-binding protein